LQTASHVRLKGLAIYQAEIANGRASVTLEHPIVLLPWYLNTRRLGLLTKTFLGTATQQSLARNSAERAQGMFRAAEVADAVAKSDRVPNLTREIITKGTPGARILASIWGVFTFRGLSTAFQAEFTGKRTKPATFSGSISIGEDLFAFSGDLSIDHVYSTTSLTVLSGRRRAFILGEFEFKDNQAVVFPFIIGDFGADLSGIDGMFRRRWPADARIHPEMIDQFEKMTSVRSPTSAQIQNLLNVSEAHVKTSFAEIIGEPFVPKDWGGERSDLYTSRLTIEGRPASAAFLLKGPAVKGPLYPARLGKRGDQLSRAFDEPADLIVIQYHDRIDNSVIRLAEALAACPGNPRQYCIVDGADTWRILEAYDKLA
jgi:hypothetical protein